MLDINVTFQIGIDWGYVSSDDKHFILYWSGNRICDEIYVKFQKVMEWNYMESVEYYLGAASDAHRFTTRIHMEYNRTMVNKMYNERYVSSCG